MSCRAQLPEAGYVYLVSLGTVLLLITACATMLRRGATDMSASLRSHDQAVAFELAEAGIDQAALNLRIPGDVDVLSGNLLSGTYTLTAPVQVAGTDWLVTSQGTATDDPGFPRSIEAVYRVTGKSIFQFALFGDDAVNVSGSATSDSYDSSEGLYDPDHHNENGDIGTNATGLGGIDVGGSIFIEGQFAVGSDAGDPASVVNAPCSPLPSCVPDYLDPFVTADPEVVKQSSDFPMPAVTVPPALLAVCGPMTVGGNQTRTLPADGGAQCIGSECCFTQVQVQGGGTLDASADVKVYLTGEFTATGNTVVGVPSDPSRMLFLVTSTGGATIEGTITGSSQFYGAMYGPDAEITITGNADVYGSIIAETINVTGSAAVHYDESLAEEDDVVNLHTTSLVAWRNL